VAAILTIPAIIAIIKARGEENPTAKSETASGFNLAKIGQASLAIIGIMALIRLLQITSMSTTLTFFNLYLDTSLQIPTAQIGLIAALGRLLAVPAALVTPFLTARRGPAMVAIWASLGGSLSMLPMALVPHWSAAGLGFMGVVALSSVRYSAFLVYSMELVSPEQRGAMSGAGEMAAGISFAMMAFGGGYLISQFGYPPLFLTGAGLSALGTLILWTYLRRPKQEIGYPASEASHI
jgi:predicted MFS family arabinose efflux permease